MPGDVLHLRTGDIVAADLELFEGSVSLDQSALTGESLPVDAGPESRVYTGSVVQRGEASGVVVATGTRTRFGRTAELVRHAQAPSHMQATILAIVKRLVIFDLGLVALVAFFAARHHLPALDAVEFALMLLVASVPVALPATYTLATALGSQSLARQGVLVTPLPAVEDAAAMDTLVSDKTGTLTQNRLTLAAVQALALDTSDDEVLRAAALASDDATQDPIDLALLTSAREKALLANMPERTAFLPFDPATRRSEALYLVDGRPWRTVKGGAGAIAALCAVDDRQREALQRAEANLAADGMRVLAVAAGDPQAPRLLGVVGLSDPVRSDASTLIARLNGMGVRVRMATGDALETALAVGRRLALGQRVCHADRDGRSDIEACDLFARVLPEDKHAIVQALQRDGHVTGMTGDGVNDAPALRQAEVGVAVASATDVAKASAGAVLTEPGLAGVLALVTEGRQVHRRMLTYTLNKTLKTFEITLLLTLGLWLTGEFVISSTLIVLLLFTNDFVTMAIATDRVPPRAKAAALARRAADDRFAGPGPAVGRVHRRRLRVGTRGVCARPRPGQDPGVSPAGVHQPGACLRVADRRTALVHAAQPADALGHGRRHRGRRVAGRGRRPDGRPALAVDRTRARRDGGVRTAPQRRQALRVSRVQDRLTPGPPSGAVTFVIGRRYETPCDRVYPMTNGP